MSDAIRQFRTYLNTHDRLAQEIRPIPTLDPASDREDCFDAGAYTFALIMAANGILSHSDDELMGELPDLRTVAEQLLARVEKLGG